MHFIFQHGWGFTANAWQGWLGHLPGSYLLADRGYWGEPRPATADGLGSPVLVCHSLGLHLLAPKLIARARLLVVISGFVHFHGQSPQDGRFSRRHLERLRSRLRTEPYALVRDFYRDCGCADWPLPRQAMDIALLDQDLTLLDQGHLDDRHYPALPPALILHGRDDRIVRPERARDLAALLPDSEMRLIEGAGHGLPFTHAATCLHHVLDRLTAGD